MINIFLQLNGNILVIDVFRQETLTQYDIIKYKCGVYFTSIIYNA